jgi:putative protease
MKTYNLPELLAPAGSWDSLTAAVRAGADAVYLGVENFNARTRAANFSKDELENIAEYCHARNIKVYLALNILIKDHEMQQAIDIAVCAWRAGFDAVITQDIGLSELLLKNIKDIRLHASTQMTVHNLFGCNELKEMGFQRIVLARELSLESIKKINEEADVETEIFIHGALCVSYSGQCLFSSMAGGRSGNRGACAQPCRQLYSINDINGEKVKESSYLLSTRDLISIDDIKEITDSGAASLKIEGRLKDAAYVALVVHSYKSVMTNRVDSKEFVRRLEQIFLRGKGTSGYLKDIRDDRLMSFESPGHRGLLTGTVVERRFEKVFFKTILPLCIGDSLVFATGKSEKSIVISKIEIEGVLRKHIPANSYAGIGYIDFDVKNGTKIYKKSDIQLIEHIEKTLLKKDLDICIEGKFSAKRGHSPELLLLEGSNRVSIKDEDFIVQEAEGNGTSRDDVIKSLEKTADSPFKFRKLDIVIDEGIYIPLSVINRMRRKALERLAKSKNTKRFVPVLNIDKKKMYETADKKIKYNLYIEKPCGYDYTSFDDVSYVYLPIEYINKNTLLKYPEKLVLFLPLIDKDTERYIEAVMGAYGRGYKRFLVRNIGQFGYFKKNDMELFADHSLNSFNSYTINSDLLRKTKLVCLSPELSVTDIRDISTEKSVEVLGYGNLRLMTLEHKLVDDPKQYYLTDERKNRRSRILYDGEADLTYIYNSDILSISDRQQEFDRCCVDYIRLMFVDETPEKIREVINRFLRKEKTDGKITCGRYFYEKGEG